ncbi:spinster family MFS transporter [Paraburkholderia sp. EG287A]|uniref:spinster family MFS transporter n=1 Tax=unclassified Paraburkholderia TaxID=2615204 RepID=UPI0034D1D27F
MSSPPIRTSSHYAWLLVFVLFCASVVSYLDRNILSLFVGPIRSELALSDVQISLLQGLAFALFYAVMGLPFGRLVDRRSRKNIVAIGIVLWSFMTICCGLSTNFWQLFFARMGVGIGEACLAPAAFSMIADSFPRQQRGRAIAAYNMSNFMGVGASLVFGGLVISMLAKVREMGWLDLSSIQTWRLVFVISALPGLLISFFVFALKEPQRREVMHSPADSTTREVRLLPYLRRHKGAFASVFLVYMLTAMVGYIIVAWAPSFYMRHFGMPAASVGLTMGAMTIATGVSGCLLGGVVSDKLAAGGTVGGRFRIPLVWWPLGVVAIVGMTQVANVTVSFACLGLLTFSSALAFSSAQAVIQDVVPNQIRGQATALYFIFVGIIGLSMGPTAVALVTEHVLGDSKLLGNSLVIVVVPIAFVGFVACVAGQRSYQKAKREMADALATNFGDSASSTDRLDVGQPRAAEQA